MAVCGILAALAYLLDTGHLMVMRRHIREACDASAMAAAQALADADGEPLTESSPQVQAARRRAVATAESRRVYLDPRRDVQFGHRWFDVASRTWRIAWGQVPYNAVRVHARRDSSVPNAPDGKARLAFGWLVGAPLVNVVETATAGVRPRDMMLLIDDSTTMSIEAVLTPANLAEFGLAGVAENLRKIWQDLGEPTFGRLPAFEPRPVTFVTSRGDVTAAERVVEVAFRTKVASVRLRYADGSSQPFPGGSAGERRRYAGVDRHQGKTITRVVLDEQIDVDIQDVNQIIQAWGLEQTPFPAPAGSWADYVRYVKSNSLLGAARLNNQYGGVTLMHFLVVRCSPHAAFPRFQDTRQYPLQRVKDAVSRLAELLEAQRLHHWQAVAFSRNSVLLPVNTSPPSPLQRVTQADLVAGVLQRQAGHDGQRGVNLGSAIAAANAFGKQQGRPGAQPIIVVLTNSSPSLHSPEWVRPGQWQWSRFTDFDRDGLPDYTTTDIPQWSSVTAAVDFAKDGGRLYTVSMGSFADHALLQVLASAANGQHLPVAEARDPGLLDAFLKSVACDQLEVVLLRDED